MTFDRAQLPGALDADAGESSWYCFEGEGQGRAGPRRVAGLVWLHRTGPRIERVSPGVSVVSPRALPAPLRGLVPSWLPLIAPVRVEQDERPLFLIVLHDLDQPATPPRRIEREVELRDFDPETFSAACVAPLAPSERQRRESRGPARSRIDLPGPSTHREDAVRSGHSEELGLRARVDAEHGYEATVRARCEAFDVDLSLQGPARMAVFGEAGSPLLRHGAIEVGYAQRPHLAVTGRLRLGDEVIENVVAAGAHDRHWRRSTEIDLQWIWVHLRLDGARAITAYVIRRSRGDAAEVGRGGWLVSGDADVTPLPGFDLRATADVDTPRGRVPVRFALDLPSLGARVVVHHVIEAPYVPMRAFGGLLDAGIHEGPIRVVEADGVTVEGGWVEVMNAAHARLGRPG